MNDYNEIGARLRELRETCDYTIEELAEEFHVDPAVYASYEENGKDVPISLIYEIANKFKVDFTEIVTGTPGSAYAGQGADANFRVIRAESYDEILRQAKRIEYKDVQDFTEGELKELFLSVDWSSGHFPDKLVMAMKNFKTVYSAWDGDKLIGMICAMDDGIMNAYIHYLLVDPQYHGRTIGRTLVEMMKEHYKDYMRIVLVAYDKEAFFYENCGFKKARDASPMFITSLWT